MIREKKAHRGKSCGHSFWFVSKSADTRDLARSSNFTKTLTMTLINIDDLLPKYLDFTTLDRYARSVPPSPDNHNGSNVTAQAV